jgi:hypothetical protein
LAVLNKNARGLRLVEKAQSYGMRQTASRRDGTSVAVRHDIEASPARTEFFPGGFMKNRGNAIAPSIASLAPIGSDALARAIADIEIASEALRKSDPTLEPWRPNSEMHGNRRQLPVWILIGTVWAAALVSLSVAIGGIVYLVK